MSRKPTFKCGKCKQNVSGLWEMGELPGSPAQGVSDVGEGRETATVQGGNPIPSGLLAADAGQAGHGSLRNWVLWALSKALGLSEPGLFCLKMRGVVCPWGMGGAGELRSCLARQAGGRPGCRARRVRGLHVQQGDVCTPPRPTGFG